MRIAITQPSFVPVDSAPRSRWARLVPGFKRYHLAEASKTRAPEGNFLHREFAARILCASRKGVLTYARTCLRMPASCRKR
jgi:hypothetical protein